MTSFPPHWLRPHWPAPANVQAVMTDRHGGVSRPPWDSMNLGDHVGDDLHSVQVNRQRLQALIGSHPVFLKQVHGHQVVVLNADTPDGTEADACVALNADLACTIMVADCLPVLMCDTSGQWVAAAHAGWRGLAGEGSTGVIEALCQQPALLHTSPEDILVWLGPCIGPEAFEVGAEVREAFCADAPEACKYFQPGVADKWLADLAGLARWRLHRLGIDRVFGNDSQSAWCTVTQASRFFSHRRDSRVLGQSGRMAASIWLGH